MNKNFTREDKIKKYQTDVKSAQTAMSIAVVLGTIHLVRFILTGQLEFYFSLAVPETVLGLSVSLGFPAIAAWIIAALFVVSLLICLVMSQKDSKWFIPALCLYSADYVFLIGNLFSAEAKAAPEADFISLAVHTFIMIFLVAGIIGRKKLKEFE